MSIMETARKKKQVVYFAFKRFFDVVLSLIGLIILLPLFIVVGSIIKIQDGGPIFFEQKRVGKNGKLFNLIKFRSMTVDNNMYDLSEEDKITKFGEFIRKTSIDELPQFWNVFMGDMSFIGPRPWVKEYYDNMDNEQLRRHEVRPGITGLAQVRGRNGISIIKKIKYDIEYVNNISLKMDVKIIFLTVKTVITRDGVYHKKGSIGEEIEMLNKNKNAVSDIKKNEINKFRKGKA